jgi:hypothetical protein
MTPLSIDERREKLRQLQHDLRTHLGVISTGLQVLAGSRDDPAEFAAMQEMILTSGLKPLEKGVAEIIALASLEEDSGG